MDNEKNESKTRDERIKELLEQPALDAVKGMKGPSLADVAPIGDVNEDRSLEAGDEDSGDKKIRIRKSRLTTLERELEDLRVKTQEADSFKQRVAALEAQLSHGRQTEDEVPDWWKEAWGDTEQSKTAYKQQVKIMQQEFDRRIAEREAVIQAEESERAERIESIESSFDEQMEELEESIGRDLTSKQKEELLDIVGEYSPTDEEGKYLAYMPVSKAYELWSKGQGINQGKREIAQIAGIQSSGSSQASSDTGWKPGSWRQKYGL